MNGLDSILPLLSLTCALVFAFGGAFLSRWTENKNTEVVLSRLLGWILVGIIVATFILRIRDGFPHWGALLPMHFCDWGLLAALYALMQRDAARPATRTAAEIAWFFIMGSVAHAFLTPVMADADNRAWVTLFYVTHATLLASALYLVFGRQLYPRRGAVIRIFGWVQLWVLCALSINFLLGTNFGFLNGKPDEDTLFTLLWPWPWYLIQLEALAFLSLVILYLPFVKNSAR